MLTMLRSRMTMNWATQHTSRIHLSRDEVITLGGCVVASGSVSAVSTVICVPLPLASRVRGRSCQLEYTSTLRIVAARRQGTGLLSGPGVGPRAEATPLPLQERGSP